jgi:four helix bundle protein
MAHDLGVKIHKMTLELPKFEIFKEGSQIRRSSKEAGENIDP